MPNDKMQCQLPQDPLKHANDFNLARGLITWGNKYNPACQDKPQGTERGPIGISEAERSVSASHPRPPGASELSLPLNGAWRLACDVIHHPVYAPDRVADTCGCRTQESRLEREPVGRHTVRGGDCPQRNNMGVRALVALHAHRAHRQKDREGLPDLVVKVEVADALHEDLIDLSGSNGYESAATVHSYVRTELGQEDCR